MGRDSINVKVSTISCTMELPFLFLTTERAAPMRLVRATWDTHLTSFNTAEGDAAANVHHPDHHGTYSSR
jgi:hypothetical protein